LKLTGVMRMSPQLLMPTPTRWKIEKPLLRQIKAA